MGVGGERERETATETGLGVTFLAVRASGKARAQQISGCSRKDDDQVNSKHHHQETEQKVQKLQYMLIMG